MSRLLLVRLAVLAVSTAGPSASAQSFEGLDLSSPKKKQPVKKKKGKQPRPEEVRREEPPPVEAPAKKEQLPPAPADAITPELDLTTPTPEARKVEEKKPPAQTLSFDAVDVAGKSGDRQRMDAAIARFKAEGYEAAAVAFHEMSQDPGMAALKLESQYWLAKSLYKLGLFHSALRNFSEVLAKGPNTRYFKSSLEWLFFIARKTVNETVVLDEIARYSNFEFPERFQSEFRYLLARYNFVRGRALDEVEQKGEADKSFAEVKRLAALFKREDPYFPRAKYLEALAHFRNGEPQTALDALKEVIRVTRLPEGDLTPERRALIALRELTFMQLARTHYGADQNRNAIFYYGKVERGGAQWLEALFEASWAHYRIGQYEQALGNLVTLSSPFFRDEYFPEALILKAVIYFENCRYREALTIIEDFERIYGPVQEELDTLVAKDLEATEYFTVLDEVRQKKRQGLPLTGIDELLERILNLALTDKDLKKTVDSIAELEREIDSIAGKGDAFRFSALAKAVIDQLKDQRAELIKKAGLMAKGKLQFELGELKRLRSNGLRIKFETTAKEKEFLQAMLASGGEQATVKPYTLTFGVPDEYLYWPYVGEFWRDELGTYQYTLTKGCIERDTANRTVNSR